MRAIRAGEVERLVRIPGVGKKTAERMVLELRDKLPAPAGRTRGGARGGRSRPSTRTCSPRCSTWAARVPRPRPPCEGQGGAAPPPSSSRSSGGRSNWCGKLEGMPDRRIDLGGRAGRRRCSLKPACARAAWPISPGRPS